MTLFSLFLLGGLLTPDCPVAAATEGYLFGIPAIAFSQVDYGWAHLDSAARVAKEVVQHYYDTLQKPYLLNVNIPNLPYEKLKGIVPTRLGKRHGMPAPTLAP